MDVLSSVQNHNQTSTPPGCVLSYFTQVCRLYWPAIWSCTMTDKLDTLANFVAANSELPKAFNGKNNYKLVEQAFIEHFGVTPDNDLCWHVHDLFTTVKLSLADFGL
jgi:hypothetical protein